VVLPNPTQPFLLMAGAGRSARHRDARGVETQRHHRKVATTRDKGTGGGQPPNTAGGNTTRGETAHRGTPPANNIYIIIYIHMP